MDTDKTLLQSQGAIAEVLREDNQLFFVGRVSDYDPMHRELRVDLHRGRETPQGVLYGTPVKVQLHIRGEWNRLMMIYGKVMINALDHWRIQMDHTVICEESRRAFRQKVKTEGSICLANDPFTKVPVTLEDISVMGVGFHTAAELEKGARVVLEIPALTAVQGTGYQILCDVVGRRSSPKPGQWRYGCSFEKLDRQTEGRLLKEILQLQARSMSRERV